MRKASPLSIPPNPGPRFAEISCLYENFSALQTGPSVVTWYCYEFLAGRNSKRPDNMLIFNELCSSLLFSQLYSVVLLWKLNEKRLHTLFLINFYGKIPAEAQKMRITGKIRREYIRKRLFRPKNNSFEIHFNFIFQKRYKLTICSKFSEFHQKFSFWLYFCLC